ncbi:NepR family anti-sigma factor [Pseudoroseomonas cervicalis]|uniref:NepR family anti-sigma factor n=1 Tax=Teichococcus cervicalis TaxID=204525 RepID=UPI0022F1BB85|nr:NepR family anti-sigma factor [Pseudoroseomonas cervicalis]WBV41730.1 NepR family anti-sigma factor [Pseudoroseomonas cervicalis]
MTTKPGAAAPTAQDEATTEAEAGTALPPRPPEGPILGPVADPPAEPLPDAARQWIDDRVRESYQQAEQEPLPERLVALLRRLRPSLH